MPATAYADLPVLNDRNRAWDAAAAEGRVRSWASSGSETNFSKYRRAFLWYDSSEPEQFGSYKLIIADVVNGTLTAIPRAVFAAAAVLQGSRGGVSIPSSDRGAVMRQIERYYNKMRSAFKDESIQVPWRSYAEPMAERGAEIMSERRFTEFPVELRGAGNGGPKIGGYAAVFNRLSQNLGGFVEQVNPAFFNKSRGDGWPNIIARYNHDNNMLLGTSNARTLHLNVDNTGLWYEVEPPRSMYAVVEWVERGDVARSSFAFRVGSDGDEWTLTDQGYPLRTLVSGQLIDVAPVTEPAYLDTTAGLRSLAQRMEADYEEVRKAADDNELRRFFKVTSGSGSTVPKGPKPKPRTFGPVAATALLARKNDPYV